MGHSRHIDMGCGVGSESALGAVWFKRMFIIPIDIIKMMESKVGHRHRGR